MSTRPNQGAAANRRPAGQSDGSDNLFATVAADRAFPAAVAELDRYAIDPQGGTMRASICAVILLACSSVVAADASIDVTLEGRWVASASDGTKITYDASKDGSITWFVEEEGFKKRAPKGLKGKYKIRVAEPVWQIDITDFEHPEFKQFKFLGIITILDGKSFRLEGRPGDRPEQFGSEAAVFRSQSN